MSQILDYRDGVGSTPEEFFKSMVNYAVDKFTEFTNNSLFSKLHCEEIEEIYPRVEAIVTFDGAWSQEYTANFLA